MHRDGAFVAVKFVAPHLVEQLGAAENLPGMARQKPQQVEFFGRERDLRSPRVTVRDWLRSRRRSPKIERVFRSLPRRRAAAQYGLDAHDQLARAERLGDVIVRAQLKPDDAVGFVAACGEHDDRDIARRRRPAGPGAGSRSERVIVKPSRPGSMMSSTIRSGAPGAAGAAPAGRCPPRSRGSAPAPGSGVLLRGWWLRHRRREWFVVP